MATPYTEIYDLFHAQVKDWRLEQLYTDSATDWDIYLRQFLIEAIDEFGSCTQSLERTDASAEFDTTLTEKTKVMLSKLMVKNWMKKEVQDVREMSLHLQGRDFRTFSEANNFRAKTDHYNTIREEVSQALSEYGFSEVIDWDEWFDGNFYSTS